MDNDIKSLVRHWTGKMIEIPSQCVFVVNAVDTVVHDSNHIFSVVNYFPLLGIANYDFASYLCNVETKYKA